MRRDGCQVQLPAEILDQIFQQLPSRDLRAVVQVCRFWREVGEAPGLWSWGVVCLARGNMSTGCVFICKVQMRLMPTLTLMWGHILSTKK